MKTVTTNADGSTSIGYSGAEAYAMLQKRKIESARQQGLQFVEEGNRQRRNKNLTYAGVGVGALLLGYLVLRK